jgi:hypothetical protein
MLATLLSADAIHGPLCQDMNKDDKKVVAKFLRGSINWRDHADRTQQYTSSRRARSPVGLATVGRLSTSPDDLCPVSLDRNLNCMTFLDPIFLVIWIFDSFPERATKFGMVVALSCIRYSSGTHPAKRKRPHYRLPLIPLERSHDHVGNYLVDTVDSDGGGERTHVAP